MTAAKHACLLLVGRYRGVHVALLVRQRGGADLALQEPSGKGRHNFHVIDSLVAAAHGKTRKQKCESRRQRR